MYEQEYPHEVPIGALTLLVEQNDVIFGVDLSNLGSNACKCAENGGVGVVNGTTAWFGRRTLQDHESGLWAVQKINFDATTGRTTDEAYLLDDPPDETQTGPTGNVDLTVAEGLKIYFGHRLVQDETTGLWSLRILTSAGLPGKEIQNAYLIDAPPTERQSGSTLNAVLTKLTGLKVYFGNRTERNEDTGLWSVQTKTTNGTDGSVVDSVKFLDKEPAP